MDIFALPKNFIKDKQKKYPDKSAVEGLKSGEGVVIEDEGRKIAVFKNGDGKILKLSPVCTNLGCVIDWDSSNKNWVCPCHNAKYNSKGLVIQGPAKKDLERL